MFFSVKARPLTKLRMKYTILGGGISGMAAAHYLTKLASTEKVSIADPDK
jgi:glycine/D-amino acid oxidase-like deaminating enzyme